MKTFNHYSGKYLLNDGANIYYEETGNVEAPVLLFLHGGFGTIEDFNVILPNLKKEFRIIGIDSRGQGMSTCDKTGITYERIQQDVEEVLKHLNIDTLTIIGHSDGGIVAYRLASFTDLKIQKIVTVSSRWHINNALSTSDLLRISPKGQRLQHPETYYDYQKLNPEPDFDLLTKSLVNMWLDEKHSGYPNVAVKKIDCPLLVVRGDDDNLTSRKAMVEIVSLVKDSRFLNVPFAKHVVFKDQQEIFMTVLNRFLADW